MNDVCDYVMYLNENSIWKERFDTNKWDTIKNWCYENIEGTYHIDMTWFNAHLKEDFIKFKLFMSQYPEYCGASYYRPDLFFQK